MSPDVALSLAGSGLRPSLFQADKGKHSITSNRPSVGIRTSGSETKTPPKLTKRWKTATENLTKSVQGPGTTRPGTPTLAGGFRISSHRLNRECVRGSFHPCGPSSKTAWMSPSRQNSEIASAHCPGLGGSAIPSFPGLMNLALTGLPLRSSIMQTPKSQLLLKARSIERTSAIADRAAVQLPSRLLPSPLAGEGGPAGRDRVRGHIDDLLDETLWVAHHQAVGDVKNTDSESIQVGILLPVLSGLTGLGMNRSVELNRQP